MTLACVIIAHDKRRDQVYGPVLNSVLDQQPHFDEVVVVANWAHARSVGDVARFLCVAPLTNTTTDALVKRDVGTLATSAPNIVYLCDDHALAPNFTRDLMDVLAEPWDVLVPNRYTLVGTDTVPLNMGEAERYCGGHAGVFRRTLIERCPWSAGPHDRLWDKHMSWKQQTDLHARFLWKPRAGIAIRDLEPQNSPWR